MTTIPNQPTRLRLVPLRQLAAAPKWQLDTMRALREPVFFWVTHGQGRITLGAKIRGFHPHNAIFIPAGTLHGLQAMTRVQGTAIYFGANHGLDLPASPLHLRLRDAAKQAEVSQLVDFVQREVDGQRPKADQAAYHQLGLLAIWLDRHQTANQDDNNGDLSRLNAHERLTARYAVLLEREFGSSLNVTDYATALGVTPTHLTRACRASYGRTALDMLQRRRLYEARRLLMETDIPVQDIARTLGFSTPSYFSRAFSQQIGQPPSTYRKAHDSNFRNRM
jgi:AraC family transcriptional activator of pobA